jgi:hypothetical protein
MRKKTLRSISIKETSKSAPAKAKFTQNHYIPIIKTKEGELWALGNTDSARKPHLTPLLEMHVGSDTKSLSQHIQDVPIQIRQAWGSRRFFFDTLLHGVMSATDSQTCAAIYQAAIAQNLSFVPVTSLNRSSAYQQAIATVTGERGVLIRLRQEDFVNIAILEAQIGQLLQTLGVSRSHTDILIDYGPVYEAVVMTQQIRTHINQLPFVDQWRTLTVAGGSFPASLAAYPANTWYQFPREEWSAWTAAGNGFQLARKPSFGDYGIRDSGAPASFGFPYPNIRYTSNGAFLIRRHDVLVKNGGSQGIHAICQTLTQLSQWRGPGFSEGDSCIAVRAGSQVEPGNAGNWTAWGMNHHFASVVDEIQTLP